MNLKTPICLLLICLLIVSCKKENEDLKLTNESTAITAEYAFFDLVTPVKSFQNITMNVINSKEGEVMMDTINNTTYIFNENGQLIQRKTFLKNGILQEDAYFKGKDDLVKLIKYLNGQLFETISYEKNKSGKLYKITTTNQNDELIEYEKFEYQNDLLSRKLKLNQNDFIVEKTVYEYSNAQLLEKTSLYGRNEQLKMTKKYSYDAQNNMIEEVHINPKGEVVLRVKNEYTVENELVNISYYNKEDQLIRSEKKKLDEKGRLIYYMVKDETGKTVVTQTKYNDLDKMSSFEQYEDDVLTESASYNYDENGFLIETIDNIERKSVLNNQFEYEIDAQKNWIKKTTNANGLTVEIISRSYVY